jgi:hypothetical protein
LAPAEAPASLLTDCLAVAVGPLESISRLVGAGGGAAETVDRLRGAGGGAAETVDRLRGAGGGAAETVDRLRGAGGGFRFDVDSLGPQFWFGATHEVGGLALASDIYVDDFFAELDLGVALTFGNLTLTPMAGIGFNFQTYELASLRGSTRPFLFPRLRGLQAHRELRRWPPGRDLVFLERERGRRRRRRAGVAAAARREA